jgi:hypothetical protein
MSSSTIRSARPWRATCPARPTKVTPIRCTRRRSGSTTNSTYSLVRPTVSTVRKSHASIPPAWARRKSAQLGPLRQGAGPSRWRRRIRCTDVAHIRIPSLRRHPCGRFPRSPCRHRVPPSPSIASRIRAVSRSPGDAWADAAAGPASGVPAGRLLSAVRPGLARCTRRPPRRTPWRKALHGLRYRNRTVGDVLAMLKKRKFSVPGYRYDGRKGKASRPRDRKRPRRRRMVRLAGSGCGLDGNRRADQPRNSDHAS